MGFKELSSLSEIYKDNQFIGPKGPSFTTYIKEHRPDSRSVKRKSSFVLIDENHQMNNINQGFDAMHYRGKGAFLNTLEEYETFRAFKDKNSSQLLLNGKLDFKLHNV